MIDPVDPLRLALLWLLLVGGTPPARGGDVPPGNGERPRQGPSKAPGPYPLDLAFTRRTISDYEKAAVSPTGGHVAYAVVTPAKHRDDWWTLPSGLPMAMLGTRVHVADAATGVVIAVGAEGTNGFSPAWSPDGTTLAYYSDEGGLLRLWTFDTARRVASLAAGVRLKVDMGYTVVMPPTWSPDGRDVLVPALPADEADADPRVTLLTSRATPGAAGGDAAAGPKVLVLTSGEEPARAPAPRKGIASNDDSPVDMTAVAVRGGAARVLLPARPTGRSGPAFARYSPSGRLLVYVSASRHGPAGVADDVADLGVIKVGETEPLYVEQIARLYDGHGESYSGDHLGRSGVILAWHPTEDVLLFLNDNRLRRLDCSRGAVGPATTLVPEWGRLNGDYLAFARGGSAALIGILPPDAGADSYRVRALGLVPLDGGPAREVPLPADFNHGKVVRHDRAALWQPAAGDTATFVAADESGLGTVVRRLDLAGGGWTTVHAEPATVEFHGMPRDQSFLVGRVESYLKPPDFYRLDPDFTPRRRLGEVEPRLDGRELGSVESFETVAPLHDGRLGSVRTAVILPAGAKRGDRLPAVVTSYGGGNYSEMMRTYGGEYVASIPTPVFTSRGFAVLLVDAPIGPAGRPGNPAAELRDAVLPQVYRAAELGYIDIRRAAVAGQSYGGYSTAALVTETNLFRAAVAVSGIYDLAGTYGRLRPDGDAPGVAYYEKGQGRMGQPPWSDLRRYLDNSPYSRADRVRTPLLMIHGRDDDVCPVQDAEQMFNALRRLGRTAQLAVYEDEGHVVYEWDRAHAIDAAERMLDFLNRHLDKK